MDKIRKPGEGCKGCFYRVGLGGDSVCNYAVATGELRGCPAGEGCIRFKRKNFSFGKKKKATNCPNCGAPIGKRKRRCEYCGTEV